MSLTRALPRSHVSFSGITAHTAELKLETGILGNARSIRKRQLDLMALPHFARPFCRPCNEAPGDRGVVEWLGGVCGGFGGKLASEASRSYG